MPFVQAGYSIEVWLDLPIDKARSHFALPSADGARKRRHNLALRAREPGAVRRNVVDARLPHCSAAATRVACGFRSPEAE
jgi:hypothetical protein